MIGYERTYKTGRTVFALIEFVGWVLVGIGVLFVIIGLFFGGLLGNLLSNWIGVNLGIVATAFAILPGFSFFLSGLMSVAITQLGKAIIDSAEVQRDILQFLRGSQFSASNEGTNQEGLDESRGGDLNPVPERFITALEKGFDKAPNFNLHVRDHRVGNSFFSMVSIHEFPGPSFYVPIEGGYKVFKSLSEAESFATGTTK